MLLSAVSVLVVAQSSSEIPERLMNNPVFSDSRWEADNRPLFLQRTVSASSSYAQVSVICTILDNAS